MAKKNSSGNMKERPDAAERYYELKSRALDDLVDAKPGQSKQYSMEELGKYRKHWGIRLPDWLKVLLVKAWFAGAVCYFILWGLGMYLAQLDLLIVLGVVLGFVTDMLTNNVIRFMETTPGQNSRWMMFPKKSYPNLIFNVIYAFVILTCVFYTYYGINTVMVPADYAADQAVGMLGVEPLLFGLLCLLYDMLFVGVKRVLSSILRDAQAKAGSKK